MGSVIARDCHITPVDRVLRAHARSRLGLPRNRAKTHVCERGGLARVVALRQVGGRRARRARHGRPALRSGDGRGGEGSPGPHGRKRFRHRRSSDGRQWHRLRGSVGVAERRRSPGRRGGARTTRRNPARRVGRLRRGSVCGRRPCAVDRPARWWPEPRQDDRPRDRRRLVVPPGDRREVRITAQRVRGREPRRDPRAHRGDARRADPRLAGSAVQADSPAVDAALSRSALGVACA